MFAISCLVLLALYCPVHAEVVSGETANTPWSGYWWPSNRGGLVTGLDYRGNPAPLEKYDLITSNVQRGPASLFYMANNYDADAETWAGLCDAWSAASILEPVEFLPSTVNNLLFRIGDKKGLLTLTYELSYQTDEYASMDSPLILHNWLLNYIGEQGVAFYAEMDPSEQAWNYPIYKYEMNIDDFGDEEYVTCTVWYANDLVDPDYSGTDEQQQTYYYTLVKSGTEYTDSYWGSQSSYNHPSHVIRPQSHGIRNPYLDYDTIKDMVLSSDDLLEFELPVSIYPGTYNMILLNEDTYLMGSREGDIVNLTLERIDDTEELIQFIVTDSEGSLVLQDELDDDYSMVLQSGVPPYEITFSKETYDNPGIYTLSYDIKTGFEYVRSKGQKGFGWGGYAMVNSSDEEIQGIVVSGYSKEGKPVDTFLGPLSLDPGEKSVILSEDFPFRNQLEKADYYGVKIHAPAQISIVNLSGEYTRQMASFQGDVFDKRLVVPVCPGPSDFNMVKSWGVYNPGGSEIPVQFRLYSETGELVEDVQVDFSSKEMQHYTKSTLPFVESVDNGWVLIDSESAVSGYQGWVSRGSDANEMIPLLVPGTKFYLPNPVDDNLWSTQLTMINTENISVQVDVQLLSTGSETMTTQIEIDPYGKFVATLPGLFSTVGSDILSAGVIRIEASGNIASYYTYSTSLAADVIALPLNSAETIQNVYCIPHVASDADWWTGITLCNTGDSDSVVKFTPFNARGESISSAGFVRTIGVNGKMNLIIGDMFEAPAISEIAHIRIEVEQGGPVYGTYGYGSSDMSMLTGAILN